MPGEMNAELHFDVLCGLRLLCALSLLFDVARRGRSDITENCYLLCSFDADYILHSSNFHVRYS